MIHYHGGPITPNDVAVKTWARRHAMVSFAEPRQMELAAEVSQSFTLDNGAFSAWKVGQVPDWDEYYEWAMLWSKHPGFDFCIIPDKIDGTEQENEKLIRDWRGKQFWSVPVWHMHESLERLKRLTEAYPRVALGSSGQYASVGTEAWWQRMSAAMEVACEDGIPRCKLHGLRMLDPTIFSQLPLSSADSTNVARNAGMDERWKGTYIPPSKEVRAMILAERIEHHGSAARWTGSAGTEQNLELFG